MSTDRFFEVAIVGGGVSGTALLYTLSRYTNVESVVLLEKYDQLATVNSRHTHNSQTLHFGDIETNYRLAKAKKVNESASMVKRYVEHQRDKSMETRIFSKSHKMVLAVGPIEVSELSQRYEEFRAVFPGLRLIEREEIARLEPKVMLGRDPLTPVVAMVSDDGYAIDYGELARSFACEAISRNVSAEIRYNAKVRGLEKAGRGYYRLRSSKGIFYAKVVVVAAGGHSLMLAKQLGYGRDYSLLSVAGSFYTTPRLLDGKVYTMQNPRLPFAAIHGDPDVHRPDETRFGPTAKAILQLERYNYGSFFEYIRLFGLNFKSVASLFKILSDPVIARYIAVNILYDLPWLGKRLFLKEVRKIVPSVRLGDLTFAKRTGGTRPQIVNTVTKTLEMGEAKIVGDKVIFNITPSPGASTCLGNAYADTRKVVQFLGGGYKFNERALRIDLIEGECSTLDAQLFAEQPRTKLHYTA